VEFNNDILSVRNLYKKFEGIEVLKNVSFDLHEKEVLVIVGPSGAGKSTLIRCINRLEEPTTGEIIFNGNKIDNKTDYNKLREKIGMVFQKFNLFLHLTAIQNITLPLKIVKKKSEKEAYNIAIEYLRKVGLKDRANHYPIQLSGGEQQRVAIARALALDPKILLCDEATSALDPKITKDILALLSKINKELGITIVMVTHQMEVIKEVCERVALLDGGVVKAEGKAEDLFLKPGKSLKKFLGEEDDEILPNEGVNIKLFFPSDSSENALITKMARELEVDFSIVWGKLEKFRDEVLGGLVININEEDKDKVIKYLENKDVLLEVIE